MMGFLFEQQSGYTNFPCFLCLWDSRAKDKHGIQREWSKRNVLGVGRLNIINKTFVDHQKIVFPPLHMQLGLMKQSVKGHNKENNVLSTFVNLFKVLLSKN